MPSMVVTAREPTAPTGSRQDRAASPSTSTVQAPHWAMPQPYFVPVKPSASRSTQSSGVAGSTSTSSRLPFTLRLITSRLLSADSTVRAHGGLLFAERADEFVERLGE